jgi:predicted NBD/HSP70 family sugar kinase/biotin operon repressor
MTLQNLVGSNINLVKSHNLQAILLTLLYERRLSRVQLAHKTSLSTTTITNLITELMEQGIVIEEGIQNNHDSRSVGRPRTNLRLTPEARFAIGVHIGSGLIEVAIVNLFGEIIKVMTLEHDLSSPAERTITQIVECVEQVISVSKTVPKKILGVGVGASTADSFQAGENLPALLRWWHDETVQEVFRSAIGLPIVLNNDVQAMVLGEAYFGLGRGSRLLAFVHGSAGVNAGFVLGGLPLQGNGADIGEIGHMVIKPEGGELCRCGRHGCLETLVSETVILRKAEQIIRSKPNGPLAQNYKQHPDLRPIERVFNAAREGDEDTRIMIENCSHFLGIALANLVNLLKPDLILLGGIFADGKDLFLPAAVESMSETVFYGASDRVNITATGFGRRAGVQGASALALLRFFYVPSLF